MIKIFYKILLTLNSIGLILIVYAIKEKIWIKKLGVLTAFFYIIILLLMTFICLKFKKFLSQDSIQGGIKSVEMANDVYLPSYLGYFFIALSIPANDKVTLIAIFAILFVFVFFSQTLYYNPIFLIFGYKFYYIVNSNDIKVFLISRQEIRTVKNLSFGKLRRINDFTFIDEER